MMFYKETRLKETSIGKIPLDWGITKVGDVSLDLVGGGTPSTTDPDYWGGDIAWMTSAHINGKEVTSGQKYITKKGLENSATHIVPKDNLLIATRVGIGKAAVNRIDIAISQDLTGVVVEKTKILTEFLYWCVISNGKKLKSLAQGSTIKGILREDLGHLLVLHLSLSEQRAIVGVLGVVDLAVAKAGEVIAKTERLKKGLMQELLTKGIGHKEYKQTPIGKTPTSWQVSTIGDVCDQRNEMIQPSGNNNELLVGLEHVNSGETRLHSYAEGVMVKSSKFKFYAGDVLYGKLRPYLDKAVVADFDGICSTDLLVLKRKENVLKEFLVYVLHSNSFLKHAIATTSGTNHPRTSWSAISKFKFGLPERSQQQRIAETLSSVDKKLELEKKEKSRLERIKQGLMDLLLTGKVRVKVD